MSFIHVVIEHDIDDPESLDSMPAFQAFVADIAERCDVPPTTSRRRSVAAVEDVGALELVEAVATAA